jgi:hypothetical protein
VARVIFSLWWTEVLARGWGTRSGATSLLDAQGATLDNLTLKTLLGGISLISSDHLYETETTRLLGMGVKHDLALLNITVFLEETSNLLLRQTRMDTGDEQVGTWVDGAIILRSTTITLGRTTRLDMAVAVGRGRSTGSTSRAVVTTGWSRGCAAVTLVTGSLVILTSAVLVLVIHRSHLA